MGNEAGGCYYIHFVSGLALCCCLVCHARLWNRCEVQQMWLFGGQVLQGINYLFFRLIVTYVYVYNEL